jgi:predicted esterase
MQLSLEYRWRLAEEDYEEGNPTIIMLHGIGSNMDDLYSFS